MKFWSFFNFWSFSLFFAEKTSKISEIEKNFKISFCHKITNFDRILMVGTSKDRILFILFIYTEKKLIWNTRPCLKCSWSWENMQFFQKSPTSKKFTNVLSKKFMKFFIQSSEDFSSYFVVFALIRIYDFADLANRQNERTKKKNLL